MPIYDYLGGELQKVYRSNGSALSKVYNIENAEIWNSLLVTMWHQCPQAVRNFLENVNYSFDDYSYTRITDYLPESIDYANTKPIGLTLHGRTFYNDVPGKTTVYTIDGNTFGVFPLDPLRWLNTITAANAGTYNARDIGGWACDGGTVKYGRLFRGGNISTVDSDLLLNELGITAELDLRYNDSEASGQTSSVLGSSVEYFHPMTGALWYSTASNATWREILDKIFYYVANNKPCFYHCAIGADRTGTLSFMLESLLGVSSSDVDKDYELTSFHTGSGSQLRSRTTADYVALVNQMKSVTLPSGVEGTLRNRCIYFLAQGAYADDVNSFCDKLNAFRRSMIDGTPDIITIIEGGTT